MLPKKSFKSSFLWKNQNVKKKDPFVVESFVIIGSFDCDHTHMQCDTFNSTKVFHDVHVGSIFATN
jgi:hypothetical protein